MFNNLSRSIFYVISRFEKDEEVFNRCVTRLTAAYIAADAKTLVMKSRVLPIEVANEPEDDELVSERNAFDKLCKLRGEAIIARLNPSKVS